MTCRILAAVMAISAAAAHAAPPPPNPAAVAEVKAGRTTVANAAWWGFDPVNATGALQAAIDSGALKVIVPNVGQDWIVDPITLAGDQEIDFEKGVVVAARKGGFKGLGDCLFRATRKSNITLRGYSATLKMQKQEYTQGEWRMCLSLDGCTDVKVLGLTLRDSGGDGIYIGSGGKDQPFCKDVLVRDCTMDNNRRQGMSVITAENLRVEHCIFRNTSGTAPRAGVDLEPNGPGEKLVDCVFRDCTMEDNDGAGIEVYLGAMNASTRPISIRFDRCRVRGGKSSGIDVSGTRPDGPVGKIDFVDCTVTGCQGPGASFHRKAIGAASVRFTRCTWRDVARADPRMPPIFIGAWTRKPIGVTGGIDFADCTVDDDRDRPVLALRPEGAAGGVADISGRIFVRSPHGARMSLGLDAHGITLKLIPEAPVTPAPAARG